MKARMKKEENIAKNGRKKLVYKHPGNKQIISIYSQNLICVFTILLI